MRVLLAGQVDLARDNGASLHQVGLANGLAALGHEVVLVGYGARPRALDAQVALWTPPRAPRPGPALELTLAALVAARSARRRFDAAHVRLSASSSALTLTAAARADVLTVELNGVVGTQMRLADKSRWAVELAEFALGRLCRVARAAIAPSPRIRRYLGDLGAPRVTWVPNGVELGPEVPADRAAARARLGLPRGAPLAVIVSTLEHGLVVRPWIEALVAAEPALRVIVAGDGPDHARLAEALRALPVELRGRVPHAEAIALMAAADVCVCPHPDDLSMKALEHAALARVQLVEPVDGLDWLLEVAPPGTVFSAPRSARAEDRVACARAALAASAGRGPGTDGPRDALSWTRTAAAIAAHWSP
jgi:glycosyltransferase involved in cell wall biosynthesis